ncbi:MAG: nuclear transport factor 2 family protein [Pseudomonas sp.]
MNPVKATPATPAEPDYTTLLRANLSRVFSERDPAQRAQAVAELFTDAPVMYEPTGVVTGRDAIADVAGVLLQQFGEDFSFTPAGAALGHHGLACMRWNAGPVNGPVQFSGADVIDVHEGKIARLWVLLDQPPG